jgi:hypothetical protein
MAKAEEPPPAALCYFALNRFRARRDGVRHVF